MRDQVRWQAHRGGGADDMPDNTLVSFRYGWELGAIPEAGVRALLDMGVRWFATDRAERFARDVADWRRRTPE